MSFKLRVYNVVTHNELELKLYERVTRFLREVKYRGIRSRRGIDIFERVLYIFPNNIKVVNYPRSTPLVAFNPGAIVKDGCLLVFPRLIFDYYWYISSIGLFVLELKELLGKYNSYANKTYYTKIVLYPVEKWELVGCEDARVILFNNNYHILYVAREITSLEGHYRSLQGYAILDEKLNVISRKFFKIVHNGESYIPPAWRDSAFLEISVKRASLLTRPSIPSSNGLIEIGWWGEVDLDTGNIELESLKPILPTEKWEFKVGFSTNTVKISSNEYLIGWHGVAEDYIYRNGVLVVSRDGELLGITDYILEPKGLVEAYGDRPGVIFGNGLILYKDYLYWIGGISDYAIGIFRVHIDKLFESIKWIKG